MKVCGDGDTCWKAAVEDPRALHVVVPCTCTVEAVSGMLGSPKARGQYEYLLHSRIRQMRAGAWLERTKGQKAESAADWMHFSGRGRHVIHLLQGVAFLSQTMPRRSIADASLQAALLWKVRPFCEQTGYRNGGEHGRLWVCLFLTRMMASAVQNSSRDQKHGSAGALAVGFHPAGKDK